MGVLIGLRAQTPHEVLSERLDQSLTDSKCWSWGSQMTDKRLFQIGACQGLWLRTSRAPLFKYNKEVSVYLYKMVYLLDSSFITLSIKALVWVLRERQFHTLVNEFLEHNVRSTKKAKLPYLFGCWLSKGNSTPSENDKMMPSWFDVYLTWSPSFLCD